MGRIRGAKKLLKVVDVFIILSLVMVSQVYKYVRSYRNCIFKYMQFTECQNIPP